MQSELETEIEACQNTIDNATRLMEQLPKLVPLFAALKSKRFVFYYPRDAKVICGIRTREDLAKVRAMYKGAWKKGDVTGYSDENLNYEATVDGIIIDIRVVELPPSCHVVETTENVPASVRKIRRLICSDPEKDKVAGEILSIETENALH